MHKLKRILIMAGGTGGHVFPGLAVAKKCQELGIEVYWLGTKQGIESKVVPEAGLPIEYISITGLRGKGYKGLLLAPFKISMAVFQAFKIIRRLKPDVVIGMGGFASGPGGLASWLSRKKLIIHEQNAISGFTNRCLAFIATRVLEGFPGTFAKSPNVVATGNPVRAEIAALPPPEIRFSTPSKTLRLLVLGGSLGAQAINERVPQMLAQLPEALRPQVLHQTGEKHLAQTQVFYDSLKVAATVVPFIQDMAAAYASADVVLCRAGALTIAELCAAGVGAILVPYPHAVDDHQTANAKYMVDNEAAVLIQQSDLSVDRLTTLIKSLSDSSTPYKKMAIAAYGLRKIDATGIVVKNCEEICV